MVKEKSNEVGFASIFNKYFSEYKNKCLVEISTGSSRNISCCKDREISEREC